jgi:hypothetical protein
MKWTRLFPVRLRYARMIVVSEATLHAEEAAPMAQQMSVLGIDIAKLVFHVVGMNDTGHVVTLLGNSKTCGEASLQTTPESQEDRVHVSGDTHSYGAGD